MKFKKVLMKSYEIFKIVSIFCWFLLLFLITINYQNDVDDLFKLFFYYTIGLAVIYRHRFRLNLELFILVIFINVYYFIFIDYNGFNPWSYIRLWFGGTMMYLTGKIFITRTTLKTYPIIIWTLALGWLAYASLNMFLYIKSGVPIGTRVAYDFWAEYPIGSTLMASYYVASGSLLFYAIFYMKRKHFYLKILFIVAFLLGCYHNILLSNRTYFVIVFITFVAMLPVHLIVKKKKALRDFIIIAVLFTSIALVYKNDVFGVKTAIEATRWYPRMAFLLENGVFADPRFGVYKLIWPQILTYPLGGYQLDLGGLTHAHNLWLDVLNTAGPYPFFLLIAYTLLTLYTLFRILISKHVQTDIKIILFSLYLGMHLYFMVEPILDGVPYVFHLFCLLNGSTHSYLYYQVQLKKKESLANA